MSCIISVIDSNLPILFKHFILHYKTLGFEKFYCCFHSPTTEITPQIEECVEFFHSQTKGYYQLWLGEEFTSYAKVEKLNILAERAKEDGHSWQAFIDCDEFYLLDTDLDTFISRIDKYDAVRSILVDRLAPNRFPVLLEETSLFEQFPLNSFVTNDLVKASVSKIFLHRNHLPITYGGHHFITENNLCFYPQWLPCYHFKWDATCIKRLENRCRVFEQKGIPWWVESQRFLQNSLQCWNYLAEPQEGIITKDFWISPSSTESKKQAKKLLTISLNLKKGGVKF